MDGCKNAFTKLAEFFQSPERLLVAVNRLRQEYADICNEPSYHPGPITIDQVQEIFQNTGPLFAADHAAAEMAMLKDPRHEIGESEYVTMLARIAFSNFDERDPLILLSMMNAHLAWQAVQPARDMQTNPLGRLRRPINKPFALLLNEQDIAEMKKDHGLVVLAADILLKVIR